jgi:uncharacterized membrane-anchored protein
MKGIKRMVFVANLILLLLLINWMIIQKENTIKNGELVLLELYPLDPRSLMQGDYMTLRYEMTRQWENNIETRGFCIVKKGENNMAAYSHLQANKTPLKENEVALKYYKSGYNVKIGAESFMFQEGQAETYQEARYGGLRVESSGSAVLVGLYNESGRLICNK